MFITTENNYDELYKWLKEKPTHVQISTFGIYAGILDTGKDMHEIGGKYASQTHFFLDKLHEQENLRVHILVGVSQYRSCKDKGKTHCQDCYVTYGKQFSRLLKHAEKWPKIEWRFADELHLKCTIFSHGDEERVTNRRILGGGRNLTDSDWADISFELPSEMTPELQGYFNEQWQSGIKVTEENLTNYVVTSYEKAFGPS